MYRIKAISDLHIGAKEDRDDFRIDDKYFVEYIEKALKNCDTLILNGDIFELWETDSYPSDVEIRNRIDKIKEARPKIFNCLIDTPSEKIAYITGNHDKEIISTGRKTYEMIVKKFGDINLLFEHGHRHDPDGKTGTKRAKVATWMIGKLEDKVWSGIEVPINFVKRRCIKGKIGRFANPETYKECARQDYAAFKDTATFTDSIPPDLRLPIEFDLICYGHTHTTAIDRFYNFTYANTGRVNRDNTIDEVNITVSDGNRFEVNLNKIRF